MTLSCNLNGKVVQAGRNEKVTLAVVIITLITMAVEIVAGILSGSMALLSDGVHMGTHAVALLITLIAYIVARRHIDNPLFSFGTGKVGILGGYTNAILLILAGLAMAYESVERILSPVAIHFNEAITVAVIGLLVNVVSAVILGRGENAGGQAHRHSHGPSHSHDDHNLKAAYLHVITDTLTSVLAIFALLLGKGLGLTWADPVVGILGAVVVIKWAVGLIKQTGSVLLDLGDFSPEIQAIKRLLEEDGTRITDIHIWQLSENERSLIVSLETASQKTPRELHERIGKIAHFDHITVEINQGRLSPLV